MRIHNAINPSANMRPVVAATILLVGVTALVGGMAYSRAQQTLGETFAPPGWGFSVQLPRHFRPDVLVSANTASFKGLLHGGRTAQLVVWRIPLAVPATALEVVRGVMVQYDLAEETRGTESPRHQSQERMGTDTGEQLVDERRSVIARAIVVAPDLAFALSLRIVNSDLDRRTRELFEKVCRSIVLGDHAPFPDSSHPVTDIPSPGATRPESGRG